MRKIIDTELLKLIDQGMNQKEAAQHFKCSEAAISRRLKKLRQGIPTSFQGLTPKRQNFAIALASGKSKTEAAEIAFDVSTAASARAIGKRLASNSDIQTGVSEILQLSGLTKTYRVNRLRQLVDSPDSSIALRAIEMTFKLDGSFSPEKHLHVEMNIDDLMQSKQETEKRLLSHLRELKELTALKEKESGVIDNDDKFSQRAIDDRIKKLEKDDP